MTEETRDLFLEVTGESQPTCKKVLDSLLHGMVKLGIGASNVDLSSQEQNGNAWSTTAAISSIADQVIKPHLLEVEPVKVIDAEGKLYVVYPSRPDLMFEDINIVRWQAKLVPLAGADWVTYTAPWSTLHLCHVCVRGMLIKKSVHEVCPEFFLVCWGKREVMEEEWVNWIEKWTGKSCWRSAI